jgi:hypothetical protein
MILNYKTFGKQNKVSSLTFSALGGRVKEKNQKPAAKNFANPSEGEAERSEFAVRIFVKKSSDFVQKVPPIYKTLIL